MSFLLLASVLSGIYIAVFTFLWPEALTVTEYWMGFMICFLVARIIGSKAKEPTGDMAFMALLKTLVPVGGLGFLGYGVWLWRNSDPVTAVGDGADIAYGTFGSGITFGCIALGACLLLMSVQISRRS